MQFLLPQIGWAWSIRVLGLLLLLLCGVSVALCRSRLPPRKGALTTWRDTLPDPRIFMDGTGAMAVTTTGIVLVDLAYIVPMTYIPSYYLDRQGLSNATALSGGDAAFAYQLLAIINAASCFGRITAGSLADRFGRYNTMVVSLFLCVVSVLCFFLPEALVPDLPNISLLLLFAILCGFVSGSNVSLTPICLGHLCETQEYVRYYASCYTIVSIACLTSISIAGSILDVTQASGKRHYWGAIVFTGISYVGAWLCLLWVRIKVKGRDWRVKW